MINGDCKVPRSVPKLGIWVNNQKLAFSSLKKGKGGPKITPERIHKLDSIGMFWGSAYPAPKPWEEHFDELKKYQNAVGHCNIQMSTSGYPPNALNIGASRKAVILSSHWTKSVN